MAAPPPPSPSRQRWLQTPSGFLRVPPSTCPSCATAWTTTGTQRPDELSIGCTCSAAIGHRHVAWRCGRCGVMVTEDCVDVELWGVGTIPVDLPEDGRAAVP